jgi:hypothetical protein
VCIGYNLDTAHFTFSEKRINYYNNVVVVGKSIQKRIITMITKTDDTIDSDVALKHIMLDTKIKIDKDNNSGVIHDDENFYLVT